MQRYLHVYQNAAGHYLGLVLDRLNMIGPHEFPVGVLQLATAQYPGIKDLPCDPVPPDHDRVPLEIPSEFTAFCERNGLTAAQVLRQFAHDLANTKHRGGSDENACAVQWFARTIWPSTEFDD